MQKNQNDTVVVANWKKSFLVLIEAARAATNTRAFSPLLWMKEFYRLQKACLRGGGNKEEVLQLCETALSYVRKILIDVRMHNEARAIFVHQMVFRRRLDWIRKKYPQWMLNLFHWFFMGYKKSYAGLFRLFLFTIACILFFAFMYSYPQPRLEYVVDKYKDMKLSPVHYIYFSGMAITTVGYGDIHPIPADKIALTLSVTEAVVGYILLGVFVSLLVVIDEPVEPPYERNWDDSLFNKLRPNKDQEESGPTRR